MTKTEFELFSPSGHLTDDGLRALIGEGLHDELHRLEAAEHLGFCDECLLRYTALLADDTLLEPQAPVLAGVTRAQRRRRVRVLAARYATVAAAACMAVVMWGAGSALAGIDAGEADATPTAQPQAAEPAPGWGARISEGLDNMTSGLDSFFATFGGGTGRKTTPPAGSQQTAKPSRDSKVREEREKLFEQDKPAGATTDKADDAGAPEDTSAAT